MEPGTLDAPTRSLLRATSEPGNDRLDAYLVRTQTTLDLLALCTLWIVVVPPQLLGAEGTVAVVAWTVRIALSVIYGIDMTIRTALAHHKVRYLRRHVVSIVAVLFPPVRVLFSIRLIRMLFRRGNLDRFLLAAGVLLVNGALIVYYFERDAAGSNIHTAGESLWWSIVTVTTVGYGDYFPVTVVGKITATFIMAIGIITVAIITAQVASTFVDQAGRRRVAGAGPEAGPSAGATEPTEPSGDQPSSTPAGVTLAEIDRRLARIEALVSTLASGAGPGSPPP